MTRMRCQREHGHLRQQRGRAILFLISTTSAVRRIANQFGTPVPYQHRKELGYGSGSCARPFCSTSGLPASELTKISSATIEPASRTPKALRVPSGARLRLWMDATESSPTAASSAPLEACSGHTRGRACSHACGFQVVLPTGRPSNRDSAVSQSKRRAASRWGSGPASTACLESNLGS